MVVPSFLVNMERSKDENVEICRLLKKNWFPHNKNKNFDDFIYHLLA